MIEFLREHWWGLSLAITAIAFAAYRLRHREPEPQGFGARSFAAVRTFRVDELRPYFGSYPPGRAEMLGAGFFVVWLTVVPMIASSFVDASLFVAFLVGALAASFGTAIALVDFTSERIIGPDRIAFISPLHMLSWTVALNAVEQCDLVPGKPYPRLRVHSRKGSFTLPLTSEMYSLLSPAEPAA